MTPNSNAGNYREGGVFNNQTTGKQSGWCRLLSCGLKEELLPWQQLSWLSDHLGMTTCHLILKNLLYKYSYYRQYNMNIFVQASPDMGWQCPILFSNWAPALLFCPMFSQWRLEMAVPHCQTCFTCTEQWHNASAWASHCTKGVAAGDQQCWDEKV